MDSNQTPNQQQDQDNKSQQWPGGGATGMDMDEGETYNGVIGGTGSDLDKITATNDPRTAGKNEAGKEGGNGNEGATVIEDIEQG